jgi:hypothetical protein
VWVEREVERVLPTASSSKPKPAALVAPKPAPTRAKPKQPRGMDTVDASEIADDAQAPKGKGKGKAAAAPVKVASGKASIMGFFNKK